MQWQRPDSAEDEPVSDIKVRKSIVTARIEIILQHISAL